MGSEVKFFHIFFRKKDRTQLLEIESSKKKLLHFAEAAFIIYCSFVIKPLLGQP